MCFGSILPSIISRSRESPFSVGKKGWRVHSSFTVIRLHGVPVGRYRTVSPRCHHLYFSFMTKGEVSVLPIFLFPSAVTIYCRSCNVNDNLTVMVLKFDFYVFVDYFRLKPCDSSLISLSVNSVCICYETTL